MGYPAKGARLFSIAVVSDTHLNKDDFETDSAFAVNRLANRRLRHVIDDLNTRDVEAVIHLGDVVHPVPSRSDLYEGAAERFFEQVKSLRHPLHLIPGNHDVGDKPMPWSPAGTVRQSYIDAWSRCFGAHYFGFRHGGVGFVGVNAQLYGSNLELERIQREWLAGKMAEYADGRIFLFSHYPPFLHSASEAEHYDNLGSRGRREILKLIREHSVEALFAGHVHHFWYNRYGSCGCYLLPSTAFTRQDYSEMFRIAPTTEFGRDDQAKLGYLLVHVYERGHEFEFIRCAGSGAKPGSRSASGRLADHRPRSRLRPVMGFELRQDWHETVQIPPSGALDEFDRKLVRNDYALLALWEMGVQRLRIPATDLTDDSRCRRLRDLVHLGFRFTLYSFAPPDREVLEALAAHADLIDCLELTGDADVCADLCKDLKSADASGSIRTCFSPLKRKADIVQSGEKYFHVINHGFSASDFRHGVTHALDSFPSCFDGVVIRCGLTDSVESCIAAAKAVELETGLTASVNLRLRGDDPAHYQDSISLTGNRIAEAMTIAWCVDFQRIYCDTLADNDRGYFPRIGLVDRFYNPRAGAKIVKHLHALQGALGAVDEWETASCSGRLRKITCRAARGTTTVFLSSSGESGADLTVEAASLAGQWLDWEDGSLTTGMPDSASMPAVHIDRR